VLQTPDVFIKLELACAAVAATLFALEVDDSTSKKVLLALGNVDKYFMGSIRHNLASILSTTPPSSSPRSTTTSSEDASSRNLAPLDAAQGGSGSPQIFNLFSDDEQEVPQRSPAKGNGLKNSEEIISRCDAEVQAQPLVCKDARIQTNAPRFTGSRRGRVNGRAVQTAPEVESHKCDLNDMAIQTDGSGTTAQTDLSTEPKDILAYARDPTTLLQAVIHNAMKDLQSDVQSCHRRVADCLGSVPECALDDDYCLETAGSCTSSENVHSWDLQSMEHEARLCSLRLQKLQKQWSSICSAVYVEFDAIQAEEDECFSDLVDDAINLCENIERILNADETSGMWSNGLAVQGLYMNSFGKREGLTSVLDFLGILRIEPSIERRSVFTLALKMLFNNRTEDHRHLGHGL
jgi:hypothetical protein